MDAVPTTTSNPPLPDGTAAIARPQKWSSLLTQRWHRSSRVVFVLALLLLAFCNLPGQPVLTIRYEAGWPFHPAESLEHGWPWTYLRRSGVDLAFVSDCFRLGDNVEEFRAAALLANGLIVLGVALAIGILFQAWQRQRAHLWHLHLRDLFAITLAVSLVGAWYFREQRRHDAEQAALWTDSRRSNPFEVLAQPGGIAWLRICLGDEHFEFLDRPFMVGLDERESWQQLDKLAAVHLLEAEVRATTAELSHLAMMPKLEALSLQDHPRYELDESAAAELPPMPNLRGLYLSQPAWCCRRIDRLTALEALRIDAGCIDEQVLREISILPNLRELALDGLPSWADLSFLPARLQLSALHLYDGDVSGAALKNIGQCRRLKHLDLERCHLDGSEIRQLAALTQLEILNLAHTNVTSEDLRALGALKQLKELNLDHTQIDGDVSFLSELENLETLSLYRVKRSLQSFASFRLKRLKALRVSGLNDSELQSLQAALPSCSIESD